MRTRRKYHKPLGIFKKILPAISAFLIIFLGYFLLSRGFLVKQINIDANGLGCVNANQLQDSAKLINQNFFLINSAKIEENLKKKFLCIKSVILRRQFPDKVIMQVNSRQPFIRLINLKAEATSSSSLLEDIATPSAQQIKDSYLVDNEGVVFDKDKDDLNIPKIYTYGLEMAFGKKLFDDLKANPVKILEQIKTFGVESEEYWLVDNDLVIKGKPTLKIIFALNDKIDTQLASLQLILSEAKINLKVLEFIDLRFDKPVIRFAPQKKN